MENERLISFEEGAHRLGGVSVKSVRRLIAAGELRAVKVLSSPKLVDSEVGALIERLKQKRGGND
jgi:hypothetical protein